MPNLKRISRPSLHPVALLLSLFLLLSVAGCTVQLMAAYDQQTDEAVTALQRKTNVFLSQMERSCGKLAGAHDQNLAFYDDAQADLTVIQTRVDAIAKNKQTFGQVAALRDSFTT